MRLWRCYTFEAAHWLPEVPKGHKCGKLHGHTYRLRVMIEGELDPTAGWVMDFAEIDEHVRPQLEELDHAGLNSVVANPTCENVLLWLWSRLKATPLGPLVCRLELQETDRSGAILEPTRVQSL